MKQEITTLDQTMNFEKVDLPVGSLCVLDEQVLFQYGKNIVLELGTFYGRSAILLSLKAEKVYTIDLFTGRPDYPNYCYASVLRSIARYRKTDNIEVLKGSFSDFKNKFNNDMFDVLFIDGQHTHEAVSCDFEMFYPKVKSGGFILFHDYCDLYPGIVAFCDTLKKDEKILFIEKRGLIMVFQKQ